MTNKFIVFLSIIEIHFSLAKSEMNYTCTGWSDWKEMKEFKEDILLNYKEIKVSDRDKERDKTNISYEDKFNHDYNVNMCELFDLDTYIRETTEKNKFHKLGVVKTAGIGSLLGLSVAIAGTFVYAKRQNYDGEGEEEPLISETSTDEAQ